MKNFSPPKKIICVIVFLLVEVALVVLALNIGFENMSITCAGHFGANIVCSLSVIAVFVSLTQKHFEHNKSLGLFIAIIIINFVCLSVDSFAWLMDSLTGDVLVWEYIKAAVVVVCFASCLLFALYIMTMVKEKTAFIKKVNYCMYAIFAAAGIVFLSFILFGNFFTFPENKLCYNNIEMAVLYAIEIIATVLCIVIVIKANLSKKWIYVTVLWLFTAVLSFALCFIFESPVIQQNLVTVAIMFGYCTTFIEIGGGNETLEKAFNDYMISEENENYYEQDAYSAQVAVIICTIRNLKNLAPYFNTKIVTDIYNDYLNKMDEIVSMYGGIILPPMNFGIKCVFKRRDETDLSYILNAIEASKKMIETVNVINEQNTLNNYPSIYVGEAVDTGKAIISKVGGGGRMRMSVRGKLISDCYYIEKSCSEGEILLSKNVYELVYDKIQISDIRHVKTSGKEDYNTVYRLGM